MERVISVMTILLGLFVAGCETAPPQMIYVPADMLPQGSLAQTAQQPSRFAGQTSSSHQSREWEHQTRRRLPGQYWGHRRCRENP
jgi:hypothetical protein